MRNLLNQTTMRKTLLALLLCPILLFSQLPAPLHNTYVHDYARVLTADQTEALNAAIKSIDTANKIKFAIVLINELPDKYSIEEYALDIGNEWRVGKGIVYVAVINQRKQRLEVSSHLEGVIPDATALHITDHIKPYFKSKDYYGGLMGMVVEINALIQADAALSTQPKVKVDTGKNGGWLAVLIIGLFTGIIGIFVYFVYRNKRREKMAKEELDERVAKHKELIEKLNKPTIYKTSTNRTYIPPPIIYEPPPSSYTGNSSGSNSNNDDSNSRRNDDNNYGGYGGTDSGSNSDSYSGGGTTNDW